MIKAKTLPEWEWQKTATFPDWKGYTDDTLAMNSMISFQSYHGQGMLWLNVADEVDRFSLYVNGVKCDTDGMTGGVWAVDISGVMMDGINTLQISNILPLGLEKARANTIFNCESTFSLPRYRVFLHRNRFLTTPKTCSILQRTDDFLYSAFLALY